MTDYEKELLADFESSDGEQVEDGESLSEQPDKNGQSNGGKSTLEDEASLEDRLNQILKAEENATFEARIKEEDIDKIDDPRTLSKIVGIIPELKSKIEHYSNGDIDYLALLSEVEEENQTEEYKFMMTINDLVWIINREIRMYDTLVKSQYKVVFPELETLVRNAIDYSRVVQVLKQDLSNIREYEEELRKIVSNEKVLVIVMASMSQAKRQFILDDKDLSKILSCCQVVLELDDTLHSLSDFISSRLSGYAPNMCVIIGPSTTSQLLLASGSLKQLSITPSCNLPALGVRELSSGTHSRAHHIQQTGYIYHSDLVNSLPPEIVKSAMRIISAKICLAARVDLSKSSPSGDIGHRYLDDIKKKIERLMAPPESSADKALPVPSEYRSKRRGGRKFRKMKERFQMSDVRKAQNRVAFGQQEDTVTDSYGEEIGLGMSGNAGPMGNFKTIKENTNTNAKMSKSMVARIESQKQAPTSSIDELDAIIFAKPSAQLNNKNATSTDSNRKSWFDGLKRRAPDQRESESPSKRVK